MATGKGTRIDAAEPSPDQAMPSKAGQELTVSSNAAPSPALAPSRSQGSTLDGLADDMERIIYFRGPRLWGIAAAVALMFFLTTVDITIATTSLVAMTADLGDFEMSSWIVTSYQVGYVAVVVIFAKLSDLIGRKPVFLLCIVIFTIFSAGCAAAQTITQLILQRAFQGLGAGGCFTLSVTVLLESVPTPEYGGALAKAGLSAMMAMVLGPILGGAISEHTTWRWIFILNVPLGVITFVLVLISIPADFPYHGRDCFRKKQAISLKLVWTKLDLPGSILLILASLAFTACFQEADSRFSWNSAYEITLLTCSVLMWISLIFWERYVTLNSMTSREPVLPWRFFVNRVIMGLLLGMIFVGAPLAVAYFQLPQRFQLVNGLSSLDAGVRVLPFGGASSFGVVLSGRITGRFKTPAIYLVLLGATLQIVGFALLSTLKEISSIANATYGYMILAGLGCGLSYSAALLIVPFAAEKRDGAVAMGAANQFRIMGGAFGVAIVTSVFNGYVQSELARLGISIAITDISSIADLALSPAVKNELLYVLSSGYNYQMVVLSAFGAAQIPAALWMWKRKQIVTS